MFLRNRTGRYPSLKGRQRILTAIIMCLLFVSLSACGGDSPLVYILGYTPDNAVDRVPFQKKPATLSTEHLFLIHDDIWDESPSKRPPMGLRLQNSATGAVETILAGDSRNIEYGFIIPETGMVFFVKKEPYDDYEFERFVPPPYNIYVYDYKNHVLLEKKIPIVRQYEYYAYSLDGVDLCENNRSICSRLRGQITKFDPYKFHFVVSDLETGVRREVDEKTYRTMVTENHFNTSRRYESIHNGKDLEVFAIYQYHDRMSENPKPQYNGIYIKDGKKRIRISKLDGYQLLKHNAIWVDDDTKIIIGKHLLDVEGRTKTSTLPIDGQLLDAARVKLK